MRYRVPTQTFDVLVEMVEEIKAKYGNDDVRPSDILTDYLTHAFKDGDIQNFTRMACQMRQAGTWPAFKNPELTK